MFFNVLQKRGLSCESACCRCGGLCSGQGPNQSCLYLAERLDCATPDCQSWLDTVCPTKQVMG